MKHYIFRTTVDELWEETDQPVFFQRETTGPAEQEVMLPADGPASVETVMHLADLAARNGQDWRPIMALIAPERLEAVIG